MARPSKSEVDQMRVQRIRDRSGLLLCRNWFVSTPCRLLVLVVVFLVPLIPAHATDHHNKRVVVNSIVAVPVAVPVATFSPIKYQNQVTPSYTDPPISPRQQLIKELAAEIAAELRGEGTVQAQAEPVNEYEVIFKQECMKCHRTGDAKIGKPQFTTLAALTAEQRIKVNHAILTERMPPNKPLGPERTGKLLLGVNTVPEVKATDAPPPVTDLPNNPDYRAVPIDEAIKSGMPPPPGYKAKPEPPPEDDPVHRSQPDIPYQ